MSEVREGRVAVPGASLFYKARGAGPVLLILQGGAADADGSDALAEQLADAFTVVSYDRRGLSRSTLEGAPEANPRLATHGDDVHHLLAALTREPAFLFGSSIGALIGLDVVARYPAQVRALVAHEPPISNLLAGAEQAELRRLQEEVEEAQRTEGTLAAMRRFMVGLGVNPLDREPDVEIPRPGPRMAANMEFFVKHHAPAVRLYELDVGAVKAAPTRVVPAVGASSRGTMHAGPTMELAKLLGTEAVEFPGGHGGYASHPRGFAAKLREVLAR